MPGNSDREVLRFDHPDQWQSRSGWRESLNLQGNKLSHVVGVYDLAKELYQRCGLQTGNARCNQEHGHGFVVATTSGLETQIGRDCGNRHGGLDFKEIVANASRVLEAQDRKRVLSDMVGQRDQLLAEARAAMRDCEEVGRLLTELRNRLDREKSIKSAFDKAMASEGQVFLEVTASQEEFERTRRRYRTELLARLDGWQVARMKSPRSAIQEVALPVVHALTEEALAKLDARKLAKKVKEAGGVRSTLLAATSYCDLARRFASKRNWVAFAEAFGPDRLKTTDLGRRILQQIVDAAK